LRNSERDKQLYINAPAGVSVYIDTDKTARFKDPYYKDKQYYLHKNDNAIFNNAE